MSDTKPVYKVYYKSIWSDAWGPAVEHCDLAEIANARAEFFSMEEGQFSKVELEREGQPAILSFLSHHGSLEENVHKMGYERVCELVGMGAEGPGK